MKISIALIAIAAALAGCSRQDAPPQAGSVPQASAPSAVQGVAAPAPVAPPVLSPEGYGAIRFGAKLADAEKALGSKAEPEGARDPACSMVRLGKAPGVRLMVENGVITRADADAGTPNSLGVAVGDSLAQVRAKAPAVEAGPHKYLPEGHYLTVKGKGGTAIVMEEDGTSVTTIRAGLQPAVAYVETCG
ncbi:hypothetical protein [Massilia cavernae]|uniref:Uncharacterized protein n=1 Tax=Massilia cavernae TaxID=2320864 RepID=A0A418XGH0_9BURK|nr:hypothetical protein [Massilia cavernae]RJG11560.1 hypothetical protein D3872_18965 [Massilia cavernae]